MMEVFCVIIAGGRLFGDYELLKRMVNARRSARP
jgi:hypothetical protein